MLARLAALIVLVLSSYAHAQAPNRTILDAVYSEAQAERGKALYGDHCLSCHGVALQGVHAPRLVGDRFIDQRREAMLDGLFVFIRRNMPPPESRPKAISESEYLDILTYILKFNEYPSGAADLKVEDLDKVMVVAKSGRQPVPSGARVVSVGCLSELRPDEWALTNATEPERTSSSTTNADELRASAEIPLGALTFLLVDREALPRFNPTAHRGHKIQVKGTIFRQPNADRISLIAVEMVGAACP